MSNYCNGTCPMYDAENGECCATDEPRVSVKPDAECFFDAYELDNPFVPPKPTNADRIRSLSDEELAGWLVDATVCERVCDEDEYCHGNECVKRVTDWLQQPAKEERHENY